MEKHLGQAVTKAPVGHEGIQEGVGMIDASINNIRELLATIRNGNCPNTCGDCKNIPTYISLADTLDQTPGVLAEQADDINALIKDIATALNLRLY